MSFVGRLLSELFYFMTSIQNIKRGRCIQLPAALRDLEPENYYYEAGNDGWLLLQMKFSDLKIEKEQFYKTK